MKQTCAFHSAVRKHLGSASCESDGVEYLNNKRIDINKCYSIPRYNKIEHKNNKAHNMSGRMKRRKIIISVPVLALQSEN